MALCLSDKFNTTTNLSTNLVEVHLLKNAVLCQNAGVKWPNTVRSFVKIVKQSTLSIASKLESTESGDAELQVFRYVYLHLKQIFLAISDFRGVLLPTVLEREGFRGLRSRSAAHKISQQMDQVLLVQHNSCVGSHSAGGFQRESTCAQVDRKSRCRVWMYLSTSFLHTVSPRYEGEP